MRGITRDVVIFILKELNIQVQERDVSLSELFAVDEVFGTGTGLEISPIIEINGREVGDGRPGPVTNKIETEFKAFIEKTGTSVCTA